MVEVKRTTARWLYYSSSSPIFLAVQTASCSQLSKATNPYSINRSVWSAASLPWLGRLDGHHYWAGGCDISCCMVVVCRSSSSLKRSSILHPRPHPTSQPTSSTSLYDFGSTFIRTSSSILSPLLPAHPIHDLLVIVIH